MHPMTPLCDSIRPVDISLAVEAQKHLDSLTKPQGSLGRLEALATRFFCIQGGVTPIKTEKVRFFTVAGDHGVVDEGIAAFPQAVTRQMVQNFLHGGAGINVLCRAHNIDLSVVDAGCVGGAYPVHPSLIDKRVGDGTANFTKEAAMSRNVCETALANGFALATEAAEQNYDIIGIGEMGIGNTTAATALFCAYLGLLPVDVAGAGAGASPEGIAHKARVVQGALALHADALKKGDAIDILAYVGGFEIATMAGIILGTAAAKKAVLIDGFIATSAYVAAVHICPHAQDYCFLTHYSAEQGYMHVLAALHADKGEKAPFIDLGFRLGEGTGAAVAVPFFRSAAAIFNNMATFEDAGVSGAPC